MFSFLQRSKEPRIVQISTNIHVDAKTKQTTVFIYGLDAQGNPYYRNAQQKVWLPL